MEKPQPSESVRNQAGGGCGRVKESSDMHHPQGAGCGAGCESPILTACSAPRSGKRKCFVTVHVSDREGKRRWTVLAQLSTC